MRKIVIIQGHPMKDSLCGAFYDAYIKGASFHKNIEIHQLNLIDLDFNPNLLYGYKKRTELEPDLIKAQQLIMEADHTVWIFPIWWGMMPAIMKGFMDRIILPGFFFKYQEKSPFAIKLMKGKTARVITTSDTPVWYYKLIQGQPAFRIMRRVFFNFVGIKSKITAYGRVKYQKQKAIDKWIKQVEVIGKHDNH